MTTTHTDANDAKDAEPERLARDKLISAVEPGDVHVNGVDGPQPSASGARVAARSATLKQATHLGTKGV